MAATTDALMGMLIERMTSVGTDMSALGFDLRNVQVKEGPDYEDNKRRITVELVFRR